MGEFTEKVKGNANEAIGNVKQESGNPETREEGKDQETKGEFQKVKGDVEARSATTSRRSPTEPRPPGIGRPFISHGDDVRRHRRIEAVRALYEARRGKIPQTRRQCAGPYSSSFDAHRERRSGPGSVLGGRLRFATRRCRSRCSRIQPRAVALNHSGRIAEGAAFHKNRRVVGKLPAHVSCARLHSDASIRSRCKQIVPPSRRTRLASVLPCTLSVEHHAELADDEVEAAVVEWESRASAYAATRSLNPGAGAMSTSPG